MVSINLFILHALNNFILIISNIKPIIYMHKVMHTKIVISTITL
jgi:hypothetical protein